jgi:hypothetical protein
MRCKYASPALISIDSGMRPTSSYTGKPAADLPGILMVLALRNTHCMVPLLYTMGREGSSMEVVAVGSVVRVQHVA